MQVRRPTVIMAVAAIWSVAWMIWTADGWAQFPQAPIERSLRRLLLCLAGAAVCLLLVPALAAARRRGIRALVATSAVITICASLGFALLSELIFYIWLPKWGPSTVWHIPTATLMALWVFLAWVLLFVAMETDAERRARALDALDARHRLLLSQAQPHFLFNALNTVYALVIANDPMAGSAILTLSDYLRRSLDETRDMVSLAAEIEAMRGYASIEQMRFGERMRLAIELETGTESVRVPSMILQPLLENCIKHAVSLSGDPVSITVSACLAGEDCVIRVADDGPGSSAAGGGTGIGMACVAERLHSSYGHGAASIVAHSPGGGGHIAELRLPR